MAWPAEALTRRTAPNAQTSCEPGFVPCPQPKKLYSLDIVYMPSSRSSGILLHPTSLPSPYGIGDLGPESYRFVDFLAESGQQLWQVLPLGPTGYGDSPYMCFSAMAGNPLLISLDVLRDGGLLRQAELDALPIYPSAVDYGRVIKEKMPLLRSAWRSFQQQADESTRQALAEFSAANAFWLDDFALFMALKEHYRGKPWVRWAKSLVKRQTAAMSRARRVHAAEIAFQQFLQFEFHRQISELKAYANRRHIEIVGDLPIYVAHDSAEVWAQPDCFDIDSDSGLPHAVAGVPPDYFSATGQLWGNPLYNWERLKQTQYEWWVQRFQVLLGYVDRVRIDHFRGFEAYWRVAYGEPTAINGIWVKGPGAELFNRLYERLGELPIIAEDLGVITPEVEALRDGFNLPGMKILQFAFGSGEDNAYLPHNYTPNCVVYTGTHDNDTTLGWFASLEEGEQDAVLAYLKLKDPVEINWVLIELAFSSTAKMSIVPLQDLLSLGTEARMNTPSKAQGNWTWRFDQASLTPALRQRLLEITKRTDRLFSVP